MNKFAKVVGLTFFAILLALMISNTPKAQAAEYTFEVVRVEKYLTILRNFDNYDSGNRIYDDIHLHIHTDDYMYLDAPQRVYFQNESYWLRNYDRWEGTQSRMYDSNDLHIATDDYIYLDAPVNIYVQNDMQINGDLTATNAYLNGYLDMTGHDIINIDNAYGNLFYGDLIGNADTATYAYDSDLLDGYHGAYYLDASNIPR